MPTSIPLPLASESIRCVDFAMSNNVDPGGTALHPEILVVVELPEPWPKPVGRHELLVDLVAAVFDVQRTFVYSLRSHMARHLG